MFDGGMAMCYQNMNPPLHLAAGVNKISIHLKTQPSSSALRAGLSSDIQASGTGNLPQLMSSGLNAFPSGTGFSSPSIGLVNGVGVIGGASIVSTLDFLEKLVRLSSRDGERRVPFIVCDDPVLSKELSSYERSYSPYLSSRNTCSQFDDTLIVENLRQKRLFLEKSGARCIVVPCHISHKWHDKISEGCSVPFLNVGECVAEELKAANLKPIEAGSSLNIGVLATNAILTSDFYQEKLKNQGFEVLLPDKATMEHTIIPAIEAFNRGDMKGARNLLRISLQVLLMRAANTVILASDDMRGLLPSDDPLLKKCTDPMDALVRSTIRWARSTEKMKDVLG